MGKEFIELIFGFIMTSPLLEESLRVVWNYENSLIFYKMMFLLMLYFLKFLGYFLIIDGIVAFISSKHIMEYLKN